MRQHQSYFDKSEKGEKFKKSYKQILTKPWFHKINMKGQDIKLINRLISNHTYDKRWLHKFGKTETSICETCQVDETAEHLIFKCNKYKQERNATEFLKHILTCEELLQHKEKIKIIREITKFIHENSIEF